MINNYWFNKLYNISTLSNQELLSLAIIFCEDKIKIFNQYSDIIADKSIQISQIFKKYAQEEQKELVILQRYYNTNWGAELAEIIKKYPWRNLHRILYKFIIPKNNFEKGIERLFSLETKSQDLYLKATKKITNLELRNLFLNLSELSHKRKSELTNIINNSEFTNFKSQKLSEENKNRLLTLIQPGLAGLMDGSVSTLGPIFAAAFATNNTRETFLVGLSASIGAGISMGFTEAIHDDGKLSGRGSPLKRGLANGIMTTLGGMGHTLPYLITDFRLATIVAIVAVFIELWIIVWIQHKYMTIPFGRAILQVVLGGLLVFFVGVFIGLS